MSLMLEEVARILRAYKELRDSRLHDVLDALSPPVSAALAAAFGSSSYALGPAQYELRSADLPGARRVLQAATRAMIGSDGRIGEGAGSAGAAAGAGAGAGGDEGGAGGLTADGGGCRAALLQEPFEELVRRLAGRVAAGVEAAARSKGGQGGAAGAGAGAGGGGGGAGFTEWGALLLRKEVRTLQQGLAALMETDSLNTEFDELNELVSADA